MVTFLFGSGADTCYSSELKSGRDFNEALLKNKYSNSINAILKSKTNNSPIIRKGSKKVFAQTVFYNKELANKSIGEEITKICSDYYNKGLPDDVEKKNILNEFFEESYKCLLADADSELKNFYLHNAQFFDTLDEKFNSLRFPTVLNSNAKRVINAYWTVFLLIMEWLYKDISSLQSVDDIIELLNNNYSLTNVNESNYYSTVKESEIKCNVVTTNYTNLAEKNTGKAVVYLHGNLEWFENIDNLQVYEAKELIGQDLTNVNLIPFILIPSGIKPLICKKQIKEFNKFIDLLDASDELCVIGYRFNSEDNHINSIVGDWLRRNNHHLTVFDYDNNIDFENMSWTKAFFKLDIELTDKFQSLKKHFGDYKITRYYLNNKKLIKEKNEIINNCFKTYINLFEK